MKNKDLKYQYLLYTWGGFYNEQYQVKHKEKAGRHLFETHEERQNYIDKLREIEKILNARHLGITGSEG